MQTVYSKSCAWCDSPFNTTQTKTLTCSVSCGRRYINDQKRRRCPDSDAIWLEHAQRWVNPQLGIIYSHTEFQQPVTTRDSYGYISVTTLSPEGKRASRKGHHLIWEAVHGPRSVPADKTINHINFDRADNRIVNLELATPLQNSQHSANAGRMERRPGSSNPNVKLHENDIIPIFERLYDGESATSISMDYGVSPGLITMVKNRRLWSHVILPRHLRELPGSKPRTKLTADDVIPILMRCLDGEPHASIARDYGVTPSYITMVKNRKVFTNVDLSDRPELEIAGVSLASTHRLTADDIPDIFTALHSGSSVAELANHYSVSTATINLVRSRKTWKHVQVPEHIVQAVTPQRGSLSEADIAPILRRLLNGESASTIARDYDVSTATIQAVRERRSWAHVPVPDKLREPMPESASRRKLSEDDVRYIRSRLAQDGVQQREIADELNVSKSTISLIARNKIWTTA